MKFTLTDALVVGFFALGAVFKYPAFGWCAIAALNMSVGLKGYEAYLASKNNETANGEKIKKLVEQLDSLSQNVGKINFRVNRMGAYVGEPTGE